MMKLFFFFFCLAGSIEGENQAQLSVKCLKSNPAQVVIVVKSLFTLCHNFKTLSKKKAGTLA